MKMGFLRYFLGHACSKTAFSGQEYREQRSELANAGLSEEALRKMDPDDRVAALEQARLDPYDFIYLAC